MTNANSRSLLYALKRVLLIYEALFGDFLRREFTAEYIP